MPLKITLAAALIGIPAVTAQAAISAAESATVGLKGVNRGSVGTVTLRETPHGAPVHVDLKNFPSATHAFHIHAVGACTPSFTAAGGHFNPIGKAHGRAVSDGPHAGDFPNIHVPASGRLTVETYNSRIRLDGRSFDDGADDYRTDSAGAAGVPHCLRRN